MARFPNTLIFRALSRTDIIIIMQSRKKIASIVESKISSRFQYYLLILRFSMDSFIYYYKRYSVAVSFVIIVNMNSYKAAECTTVFSIGIKYLACLVYLSSFSKKIKIFWWHLLLFDNQDGNVFASYFDVKRQVPECNWYSYENQVYPWHNTCIGEWCESKEEEKVYANS